MKCDQSIPGMVFARNIDTVIIQVHRKGIKLEIKFDDLHNSRERIEKISFRDRPRP